MKRREWAGDFSVALDIDVDEWVQRDDEHRRMLDVDFQIGYAYNDRTVGASSYNARGETADIRMLSQDISQLSTLLKMVAADIDSALNEFESTA